MADKKVSITIVLNVTELLFDIRNKAFLTGRSREAEAAKTYEASAVMKASEDEEDISQLLRSIGTHWGTLRVELAEYSDAIISTGGNNLIKDGARLEFLLKLPSNYNKSTTDGIAQNLHAYIVSMSLADWFEITDKADAQSYRELAVMNLDYVKRALCKRVRPTRPTETT